MNLGARLGLLATVTLLAAACTKREGPPVGARAHSLADSSDQILYGSKFTITDRGLRRADIEGDTSYFFHDNTRIVLRPLRGTFFSSMVHWTASSPHDRVCTTRGWARSKRAETSW